MRPGEDEGQILLLTLGYTVLALLLVSVIAGATAVHLQRKQLLDVADGAALAAAGALDSDVYYTALAEGIEVRQLPLSDSSVRESAGSYLDRSPAVPRLRDVALGPGTGSVDGVTATVELTATARLPFVSVVLESWSGGIPLRVRSEATAPFQP